MNTKNYELGIWSLRIRSVAVICGHRHSGGLHLELFTRAALSTCRRAKSKFLSVGGKRQDYVYHGFTNTCQVLDLKLQPVSSEKLYDFSNIRSADGPSIWRTTWKCGGEMTCVAWNVGRPGERVFVADGWGQRDWKNSDIGATIPYVVRRREGEGVKTFVSVFEGHEGEPFVRGVKLLDPSGVLLVETALGRDYVMSALDTGSMKVPSASGEKRVSGRFAVVSVQNDSVAWTFVQDN